MVFKVRQIEEDDELYRRIAPSFFKVDGSISSGAYKLNSRPDKEISVNLAYLTTVEKTLQDRPNFGVGSLIARSPRDIGLDVVHDPQVNPDNESHSLIKGACTNELVLASLKQQVYLKIRHKSPFISSLEYISVRPH